MRQRKELAIDALQHQVADLRWLHAAKGKRAGEGRQRPAAIGIGRGSEILVHQPQLAEARRREDEAVEQRREAIHAYSSSSKPISDSARAR